MLSIGTGQFETHQKREWELSDPTVYGNNPLRVGRPAGDSILRYPLPQFTAVCSDKTSTLSIAITQFDIYVSPRNSKRREKEIGAVHDRSQQLNSVV